jgi:hypothetical protein
MGTTRIPINRPLHRLTELEMKEALSLDPPWVSGGFDTKPVDRGCDHRDEAAIAAAWRERERELLEAWTSGWVPSHKFAGPMRPGKPGTRPPGWWKYCAPTPRRRGETETQYLDRTNSWLVGEREAALPH